MSTWELFRTLSSKSRLTVIRALEKDPLRYSAILKVSGLNTTDLSRQLSRLIKDARALLVFIITELTRA